MFKREREKYSCLALSRNKNYNSKTHLVDKVTKLQFYRRLIEKTVLQVLSLCVFLNVRHLTKCFAKIYRAQYGAAICVSPWDTNMAVGN